MYSVKNTAFKRILHALIFIMVYNLLFQSLFSLMIENSIYNYPSLWIALKNYIYNFIPTLLLFIIDWIIVFHLSSYTKSIEIKIAIDFVLAGIAVVLINELFIISLEILSIRPRVNWAGTFFCNIFMMFVIETVNYLRRYKLLLEHKEQAQRMELKLRYNVLKAQINPHFLFNSLNILHSLISLDTEKSKRFVLALSKMYRYIVQHHNDSSVSMEDEMEFLDFYVRILKIRYEDCFNVNIAYSEKIHNQRIIPYTMQLLVENTTKHNVICGKCPMNVEITIGDAEVTVKNPIYPKTSDSPSQIGISYLTQLYAHYGKKFRIINDGKYFTAFVPYLNYKAI